MANEKPRYPAPRPLNPERLRDPDYIVRGYKAALFDGNPSDGQRADSVRNRRLTAWFDGMPDEDRRRPHVAPYGQPYDAAAERVAKQEREEKGSGEKGEGSNDAR